MQSMQAADEVELANDWIQPVAEPSAEEGGAVQSPADGEAFPKLMHIRLAFP